MKKLIRFEVFKRDGFACAYCGRTPPDVMLEVDHIIPKADSGVDDLHNLITACFDCNRGKRDIPLDKLPNTLHDNLQVLKERQAQLGAYNNFLSEIRAIEDTAINRICGIFQVRFPHRTLSDAFRTCSLRRFLKHLPPMDVYEAMELACARFRGRNSDVIEDTIKYFCGICWRKIKRDGSISHD